MPYRIVREFEETIAAFAGARFGIAVESCSAALFLSLLYRKEHLRMLDVLIPARTYPSVPCAVIHAGGRVRFHHTPWRGLYQLEPYWIWDSALRFCRGMYQGGLHCLSFHSRKRLNIGRGGMILTDDEEAYFWLKKARFDGRDECDLSTQETFTVLGWNMYMQPEQAARGLLLFSSLQHQDLPDLDVMDQGYPNLSKSPIYTSTS